MGLPERKWSPSPRRHGSNASERQRERQREQRRRSRMSITFDQILAPIEETKHKHHKKQSNESRKRSETFHEPSNSPTSEKGSIKVPPIPSTPKEVVYGVSTPVVINDKAYVPMRPISLKGFLAKSPPPEAREEISTKEKVLQKAQQAWRLLTNPRADPQFAHLPKGANTPISHKESIVARIRRFTNPKEPEPSPAPSKRSSERVPAPLLNGFENATPAPARYIPPVGTPKDTPQSPGFDQFGNPFGGEFGVLHQTPEERAKRIKEIEKEAEWRTLSNKSLSMQGRQHLNDPAIGRAPPLSRRQLIEPLRRRLSRAKKDQRDIFRVRPRSRLPDLDPKSFVPSKGAPAFHWDAAFLAAKKHARFPENTQEETLDEYLSVPSHPPPEYPPPPTPRAREPATFLHSPTILDEEYRIWEAQKIAYESRNPPRQAELLKRAQHSASESQHAQQAAARFRAPQRRLAAQSPVSPSPQFPPRQLQRGDPPSQPRGLGPGQFQPSPLLWQATFPNHPHSQSSGTSPGFARQATFPPVSGNHTPFYESPEIVPAPLWHKFAQKQATVEDASDNETEGDATPRLRHKGTFETLRSDGTHHQPTPVPDHDCDTNSGSDYSNSEPESEEDQSHQGCVLESDNAEWYTQVYSPDLAAPSAQQFLYRDPENPVTRGATSSVFENPPAERKVHWDRAIAVLVGQSPPPSTLNPLPPGADMWAILTGRGIYPTLPQAADHSPPQTPSSPTHQGTRQRPSALNFSAAQDNHNRERDGRSSWASSVYTDGSERSPSFIRGESRLIRSDWPAGGPRPPARLGFSPESSVPVLYNESVPGMGEFNQPFQFPVENPDNLPESFRPDRGSRVPAADSDRRPNRPLEEDYFKKYRHFDESSDEEFPMRSSRMTRRDEECNIQRAALRPKPRIPDFDGAASSLEESKPLRHVGRSSVFKRNPANNPFVSERRVVRKNEGRRSPEGPSHTASPLAENKGRRPTARVECRSTDHLFPRMDELPLFEDFNRNHSQRSSVNLFQIEALDGTQNQQGRSQSKNAETPFRVGENRQDETFLGQPLLEGLLVQSPFRMVHPSLSKGKSNQRIQLVGRSESSASEDGDRSQVPRICTEVQKIVFETPSVRSKSKKKVTSCPRSLRRKANRFVAISRVVVNFRQPGLTKDYPIFARLPDRGFAHLGYSKTCAKTLRKGEVTSGECVKSFAGTNPFSRTDGISRIKVEARVFKLAVEICAQKREERLKRDQLRRASDEQEKSRDTNHTSLDSLKASIAPFAGVDTGSNPNLMESSMVDEDPCIPPPIPAKSPLRKLPVQNNLVAHSGARFEEFANNTSYRYPAEVEVVCATPAPAPTRRPSASAPWTAWRKNSQEFLTAATTAVARVFSSGVQVPAFLAAAAPVRGARPPAPTQPSTATVSSIPEEENTSLPTPAITISAVSTPTPQPENSPSESASWTGYLPSLSAGPGPVLLGNYQPANMEKLQVRPAEFSSVKSKAVEDARQMQATVIEMASKAGKDPPKYALLELIGKGSFGRVYKGKDMTSAAIVAVKIIDIDESDTLNPRLADSYSEFLKEVNALKILSENKARNINHVIEALPVGQSMWMITEYCGGGSIATLMKPTAPGGLQEKWIIPILREVAEAVKWVHQAGIIHRDIKCANVLITEQGGVQLCDFGVAGIVETTLDKRSTIIGTPHWMAPELFAATPSYGNEVDIWAFGSMVFEIATGLPPNVANGISYERLGTHLKHNVPRLEGGNYSNELRSLVAYCLEELPSARPTIEQVQKHPYIHNTSSRYPASSLSHLVKAFKMWEDHGGSRKSLFMVGGAQGPSESSSSAAHDDEWNFSTTAAFDQEVSKHSSAQDVYEAYGTSVVGFAEETTRPNQQQKGSRRRPPPEALARLPAPLEKIFDPNTLSNYEDNSRNHYGRVFQPPTSDLPLRDDTAQTSIRDTMIDLGGHDSETGLSSFPDMDTIRAGRPGRDEIDDEYGSTLHDFSRPALSDPADINNNRRTQDWKFPTMAPPASADPEISRFPNTYDIPRPAVTPGLVDRPALIHHPTEPVGAFGGILGSAQSAMDRMSMRESLIDLDMSLPDPIPEFTRPSTANSDVGSTTSEQMNSLNPFELERHASLYQPLPVVESEPEIYAADTYAPHSRTGNVIQDMAEMSDFSASDVEHPYKNGHRRLPSYDGATSDSDYLSMPPPPIPSQTNNTRRSDQVYTMAHFPELPPPPSAAALSGQASPEDMKGEMMRQLTGMTGQLEAFRDVYDSPAVVNNLSRRGPGSRRERRDGAAAQ